MKYSKIREEELKNKVGQDFFSDFDTSAIIGNIDFCIAARELNSIARSLSPLLNQYILWAEAKTGNYDVYAMFAQLIITIGKARTFDKHIPPSFLGVFDYQKIVFVPYNQIVDIFLMNDFNWNVAPSNHETKEFHLIKSRIENILETETYQFDYINDETELRFFIKNNLANATSDAKIHIDKNNFVSIYLRWLVQVKPHISFDWEAGKKQNILDSDFFLADLFVDDKGTTTIDDDISIKEDLYVIFKNSSYFIAKENIKQLYDASIAIKDKNQYEQFWKKYKRPPISEFHNYIINRRDLLIPQDIRERKGAFFTPRIWVELSQRYLADTLGRDWQEEYYIWDCAAGTGNLMAGLTNKYNIYASTLDQADVNVMHDRIKNGAILLKDHCFQFDFLNDDFVPISKGGKMPEELYNIITNERKRKKLVIYINPPYAEIAGNKVGVNLNRIHDKYQKQLEVANRELYAQFLIRIYFELKYCLIGEFSKLKALTGSNFKTFRNNFKPKLLKCFIMQASTFDNVKGKFPIGFKIWDTSKEELFVKIKSDIYDSNGIRIGKKVINSFSNYDYFSSFIKSFKINNGQPIAWLEGITRNDFQSQNGIVLLNKKEQIAVPRGIYIYFDNIKESSISFAVRHCIRATWINDRDQFLYPNNDWKTDGEFQHNCLAYTLFHSQNRITASEGTNHWIPFTEQEVEAGSKFRSNFMTDYIKGKIQSTDEDNLFVVREPKPHYETPLKFSKEAKALFDAGRELWKYYHSQKNINVNASLYDIREHFQGRNENGKMNNKSKDQKYNELMTDLRTKLEILGKKIEPKIYEYGFLKE